MRDVNRRCGNGNWSARHRDPEGALLVHDVAAPGEARLELRQLGMDASLLFSPS